MASDLPPEFSWIPPRLKQLQMAGLSRSLTSVAARLPGRIRINGRWMTNFGGNDYLGLSEHPALAQTLSRAASRYGVGATASRLVCGTHLSHLLLEAEAAAFKGHQRCMVFPSGYQANLAAIVGLADNSTVVYSDAFNHASIVDGCRLTRATRRIYPHGDVQALNGMLRNDRKRFAKRLVVTDTVFSTDGSVSPLADIHETSRRHGAMLVLDEAHATGVLGPSGKGLAAKHGFQPAVQVATFSKAMGVSGGFITCSEPVQQLLLHTARSFTYTTAIPVPVAETCRTALRLVSGSYGDHLRQRLNRNVALLKKALTRAGFNARSESHIIALSVGDPAAAMSAAAWLMDRGIYVAAFRPPTVPEGSSLLRLSPTATHTEQQIESAERTFTQLHRRFFRKGRNP